MLKRFFEGFDTTFAIYVAVAWVFYTLFTNHTPDGFSMLGFLVAFGAGMYWRTLEGRRR
jgi:hypothetical protein